MFKNVKNSKMCPCNNCSKRCINCHSNCINYIIWSIFSEKYKKTKKYNVEKEYLEYVSIRAKRYRQRKE